MSHAALRLLGGLLIASGTLVGCGASTSPGNTDAGTDAGTDLGARDTGPTSACPATLPDDGAACARDGLVCEYGDDPRPQCRAFATCMGTRWSRAAATCTPPPPVTCPASREAAAGQVCAPLDAFCAYEGLACECTNCTRYPIVNCVGPYTWHCDTPNDMPSCPAARPRAGDACPAEGLACNYGCEPGRSRRCTSGVWAPADAPGGCPVSTRSAKRDIAYVTTPEAEALARDVLATRLATYEYTEPLLAGRRRLGFILEDQPAASYAREPDRSAVDLYGYTSMLVATVQSQERRIRALESSLAALTRPSSRRHATPAR